MMWGLGPVTFLTPWLLAAVPALPLLWWLLKTLPPSPRPLIFPAIRLLAGLAGDEQTTARTPLWLLLLRLFLALLLIVAAAHPVLDAVPAGGGGPLLVVIDNGWAAARLWNQRQATADHALTEALRSGQPVRLLTTAVPADGTPVAVSPPLSAADAKAMVQALKPLPWPSDRGAALKALDQSGVGGAMRILWVTDGLSDPQADALAARLNALGVLDVVGPPPSAIARQLLPPQNDGGPWKIVARRAAAGTGEPITVRVSDTAGRTLMLGEGAFAAADLETLVTVALPADLRNRVARLDLDGETSAAAVVLLDDRWRRHPVGLIDEGRGESAAPLLDDLFYVEKALAPRAEVRRGKIGDILRPDLSLAVLPDLGSLSETDAAAVRAWVEGGGVLLRLAGPKLARNPDDLLPVRLRGGGRMLGGAMSWTKPMPLAAMPEKGPFTGLSVPEDVTVSTQLLAEPGPDLDERTWARLSDGTPLVTGVGLGKGWLVLVHTTVGPDWSTLGFSGLLPDMVDRLLSLSRGVAISGSSLPLAPDALLDGFGHLEAPGGVAEPWLAAGVPPVIGPKHPPGYYGDGVSRRALNLGGEVGPMKRLGRIAGAKESVFGATPAERDLQPSLLLAALALFFADMLALLLLQGMAGRTPIRRRAAGLAVLLAIGIAVWPRGADAQSEMERKAAVETRLAYVLTGRADIDDISRAGLSGLSQMVNQRTTTSLGDPMGVDVTRDPLTLFPLLYWPVTSGQGELTAAAQANVNDFMRHGGLILFDTRDPAARSEEALRAVTHGLDIPPLAVVNQDHVLTHSFYLLRTWPGRLDGAPVYVAAVGDPANDNVSPVVIGSHDWAAAWAIDRRAGYLSAVVPGGEQQREMAYRFGINLVMYALTGSYKADQVHLPAILERLKR
jgi:hypothetical protein